MAASAGQVHKTKPSSRGTLFDHDGIFSINDFEREEWRGFDIKDER